MSPDIFAAQLRCAESRSRDIFCRARCTLWCQPREDIAAGLKLKGAFIAIRNLSGGVRARSSISPQRKRLHDAESGTRSGLSSQVMGGANAYPGKEPGPDSTGSSLGRFRKDVPGADDPDSDQKPHGSMTRRRLPPAGVNRCPYQSEEGQVNGIDAI